MTKRYYLIILVFFSYLFSGCDADSDPSDEIIQEPDEKNVIASINIMTYNIHHCNPPSKPGVIDMDAIVRTIQSVSPDLVALQEVDVNTERSGPYDQAAEIAEKLGMHYYFGKAIDYDGGAYGVAILSKYRLSDTRTYRLPSPAGGESRVLAVASLKLPDSTAILFASTHLDAQSASTNRLAQIERIVEIAEGESLPFIIGGDFNAIPESEEMGILDSYFDKTCRLCPPTIPVTTPTRAIDFIVYHHPEKKFDVDTHRVVDERYASDHRPVAAIVNLIE